jgi:hypothetical protein
MRTSSRHQPEAQNPDSSAIHKLEGRLPHLSGVLRTLRVGRPALPPTRIRTLARSEAISSYLNFRTTQVCPKDRLTCHWQAPPAANRLRTVTRWLV